MAIQQFSPPYTPFVNPATGSLTQEATIFLREIWMRVGGSSAPSNNDLSLSEYADAGIESIQADVYHLRDQLDSVLTHLAELQAVVTVLRGSIQSLDQGVSV